MINAEYHVIGHLVLPRELLNRQDISRGTHKFKRLTGPRDVENSFQDDDDINFLCDIFNWEKYHDVDLY